MKRCICVLIALLLAIPVLVLADSYTTYYHITKPSRGSANWDTKINTDMDTIDAAINGVASSVSTEAAARAAADAAIYTYVLLKYGDLVARMGNMPEIYITTGTFNGPTGTVITLPTEVSAISEYGVAVEITSRAGAVGDVYVTQGLDNATIHCVESNTTDTFKAIVIYSDDQNVYGTAINRKWYVSPLDSITDHCDNTTEGSLHWVSDQIGSYYATIELPGNHIYDITTSCSIPSTHQLLFQNGAVLKPTAGDTITFDRPEQIIAAPTQQIIDGDGSMVFTNPGTVYADWWGPAKDGVADDYTDLNATITSVPAKSIVKLGNGTHRVTKEFYIDKGIVIEGVCSGEGTVIKSISTPTTLLTWKPANPDIEHTGIRCITLDGNDTSTYGLYLKQGNLNVFEDIVVQNFTGDGVHAESSQVGGVDENLHSITLNRFSFKNNANGVHFQRGSSTIGNTMTINASHCYYNSHACAWAHGDNSTLNYNMEPYGTTITWNGGSVEGDNAKADDFGFLATAGSTIHVNDAYIEMYGGGWDYYAIQKSAVYLRGGSSSMVEASMTEDNSTICLAESTATTTAGISYNVGNRKLWRCVGDLISDNLIYGSPEYPTPRTGGYVSWKGDRWVNAYGTEYVQVADGTEQTLCNDEGTSCTYPYSAGHYVTSGNNRWTPQNRVVIPVSAADLNGQTKDLFWAEGDYLLYNVQFVVVRPFVTTNTTGCTNDGGDVEAFFNIGTDSSRDQFISAAQGGVSNLIENATISAWDNNDTEAVLYHQEKSHPSWWMPGRTAYSRTIYVADNGTVQSGVSAWPSWTRSYIKLYACPYTGGGADGNWTDGLGYIVITGDSLEFNNSDTR